MRTNAIVVATACLPEPRRTASYAESPGRVRGLFTMRRDGTEPPSLRRVSNAYSTTGLLAPGW